MIKKSFSKSVLDMIKSSNDVLLHASIEHRRLFRSSTSGNSFVVSISNQIFLLFHVRRSIDSYSYIFEDIVNEPDRVDAFEFVDTRDHMTQRYHVINNHSIEGNKELNNLLLKMVGDYNMLKDLM